MSKLIHTITELREYLKLYRQNQTVGFVPTMGALHIGHLSLIHRAKTENDLVIVSIFVNPLQFGPTEDFSKYPRPLNQDLESCQKAGVDVVFAPSVEELYPQGQALLTTVIPPQSMTDILCGLNRPGHFQGVTTIVSKLFNIVGSDRAYFGQKDAQQVAIIKKMVSDLNIPVEIVTCPTIRETTGLAFSSRNQYLSSTEKEQAAIIYQSLQEAKKIFIQGQRDRRILIKTVEQKMSLLKQLKIEYIDLVDPITLTPLTTVSESGLLAVAVKLGTTRLIDNITLQQHKPIIAIDGPAGAGKSTITREVAQKLGLLYLDTGAMYRAVTWLVLNQNIDREDHQAIAQIVQNSEIKLETTTDIKNFTRVWINQQEITQEIRSLEITSKVSAIAAIPVVRTELVKQQQKYGEKGGLIAEGRDICTHVFPQAEVKIYLTASVQERALRRQKDLQEQGQPLVSLEYLEQTIQERDHQDSNRAIAPLQKAPDAIEIITDKLSINDVVNQIISLYHQALEQSETQTHV